MQFVALLSALTLAPTDALSRSQIASTERRAPSAGAAPTQLDPVASRQKSFIPPVPLFDESATQYQDRIAASAANGANQSPPVAGPSKQPAIKDKREEPEKVHAETPPAETQLFE